MSTTYSPTKLRITLFAGCRRFTKAEALDHWGNDRGDSSARAELFVKAIGEL